MNRKKIQIFILISILSVILVIFITYKVTNPQLSIPEPDIEEYPVSSSKYLINQRNILNKITEKFNNKQLINKYITNNAVVNASVAGNVILVEYNEGSIHEQFDFVLDQNNLSINVSEDKNDLFMNIFKVMVEANQLRLGNNNDLSSYFDKYLTNSLITDNIIISKNDDNYEYVIIIDKIINIDKEMK